MATQVQYRKGTTAQHASFTGQVAEMSIDTDKNTIVVHDGVTIGGFSAVREGSNISLLTNDSGYLNTLVGQNISDLTNNSGYIMNITSEPIGDLVDVQNTTPVYRDVLIYDGISQYENRPLVEADISDLGTYETANANIQAHIADSTLHYLINDSGTATTDLWSADKITTELANKADGSGVSGTFTTVDSKTVTVVNGIITSIV